MHLAYSATRLRRRVTDVSRGRKVDSPEPGGDITKHAGTITTVYRLAAFLGWSTAFERDLAYLDYGAPDKAKRVLDALSATSDALAKTSLDVRDGRPHLLLWSDQQLAIGALMIENSEVMGFERFLTVYDDKLAKWLDDFARDLAVPEVQRGERMRRFREALAALINELDPHRMFDTTLMG
jgi:hypothetical protein